MDQQYDKMKFIEYVQPVLSGGSHTINVTQTITEPEGDSFTETARFYVASRAYTLEPDAVFGVSPSENECGDFSRTIPFITLKNATLPWAYRITEDIKGTPVPWMALVVVSAAEYSGGGCPVAEGAKESDMTIGDLLGERPSNLYFPDRSLLPAAVAEKEDDLCHVLDLPRKLYDAIMPSFEEMTYLTHGRRVNLADTEDRVCAMDGDFSVVMANRFVPAGEGEVQKSVVHLLSMLGMQGEIPDHCDTVRLVSLYHFPVFSIRDHSEAFAGLIENLRKNTGAIGYDRKNEVLKQGYVPKKHYTRTGETTYSLYRSPLIPYENKEMDTASEHTADGRLIYDPDKGIFDASYAAAFQMGRLIALNRKADSGLMAAWRKKLKMGMHKKRLAESMAPVDIYEAMKNMIGE